jgi:hypothetical protein
MSETTSSSRVFFARNDKLDSAKAIEALKMSSTAETIEYLASVKVTPADWHAAHAVGAARTAIALARGRTSSKHRRPDDERIDTEGAMGELLAASVFGPAGAIVAPLVEWKPTAESVDLDVDESPYDVKAVSQTKRRVCINRRSHVTRHPRAYVLVHLVADCVADFYVVSGQAVDAWKVFTGFDPYFAAEMPHPMPLPDADDAE